MIKKLILIAGMPGTGKSTFARYLSTTKHMPLVCYDEIKSKEWAILEKVDGLDNTKMTGLFGYEYFWFFIEELMKSGSTLIAEYFFHPLNEEELNRLVDKYGYESVTVVFDSDTKIAYNRFTERNKSDERDAGLRVNLPYQDFEKATLPNKSFCFGDKNLYVNTDDFESVSYDRIVEDIIKILC